MSMSDSRPVTVPCKGDGCDLYARRVFTAPGVTGFHLDEATLRPPEGMSQREFDEHLDRTGGLDG